MKTFDVLVQIASFSESLVAERACESSFTPVHVSQMFGKVASTAESFATNSALLC